MREGEEANGLAERELELCGQLTLDLGLPWEGRSTRVLTRSYSIFSFGAEGMRRLDLSASHVGDDEVAGPLSEAQLSLFKEFFYG